MAKVAQEITDETYDAVGQEVFLTDLARELAQELGQNPPTETNREEKLAFDTFDPRRPRRIREVSN